MKRKYKGKHDYFQLNIPAGHRVLETPYCAIKQVRFLILHPESDIAKATDLSPYGYRWFARNSYGDNAIGYVQVARNQNICEVKARVTPEHSLHKKAYNVNLTFYEIEENVISVQCEDCAASSGGCKHAIAPLAWLHRHSDEPVVTSVASY